MTVDSRLSAFWQVRYETHPNVMLHIERCLRGLVSESLYEFYPNVRMGLFQRGHLCHRRHSGNSGAAMSTFGYHQGRPGFWTLDTFFIPSGSVITTLDSAIMAILHGWHVVDCGRHCVLMEK